MKYKRRLIPKNIMILGLFIVLTTIWIVLIYLGYHDIKVVLKGNSIVKSAVNEAYNDAGFLLYDNEVLIDSKTIRQTKSSRVDITKIGNYTYSYEIDYKGNKYYLERIVEVVDEEPPVIDLKSTEIIRDTCTKKNNSNIEYTVTDNYDGDLTENVEITETDNKYILSVKDSSGNEATAEVSITNTSAKKSIKLNGNSTVYVKLNGTYKEQGANYYDGCSTIKDAPIKISGEVDVTKVGNYTIKYSYNGVSASRKVVVYDGEKTTPSSGSKTIYLTFDDGPSKYTKQLLDILDKYNVKATFFVVGNNTSVIGEEYRRGHAIGVHTLTHNWSIYKSLDTYLADFNKMNDIVERETGSRAMIFRFPGGSSNTVSRKYAKGIVKQIADYMTAQGYVYYDWNVSAGDASSNTGEQVYKNVVNGVKNCTECVILMHDSKQKTVNQVENILKTFIERGYTFKTLDVNGPVVHHNIKN